MKYTAIAARKYYGDVQFKVVEIEGETFERAKFYFNNTSLDWSIVVETNIQETNIHSDILTFSKSVSEKCTNNSFVLCRAETKNTFTRITYLVLVEGRKEAKDIIENEFKKETNFVIHDRAFFTDGKTLKGGNYAEITINFHTKEEYCKSTDITSELYWFVKNNNITSKTDLLLALSDIVKEFSLIRKDRSLPFEERKKLASAKKIFTKFLYLNNYHIELERHINNNTPKDFGKKTIGDKLIYFKFRIGDEIIDWHLREKDVDFITCSVEIKNTMKEYAPSEQVATAYPDAIKYCDMIRDINSNNGFVILQFN